MRTFNAVTTRYPFLDANQFFEANQAAWEEYWPTVEKSSWLGDVDGASLSFEAWRRTLARCGSEDESIAQFAFETHRLGRDAYRAFDDVQQLLDYAEETGHLQPTASPAGSRQAHPCRVRAGLRQWVDPGSMIRQSQPPPTKPAADTASSLASRPAAHQNPAGLA
jgi:hypothetical protein